MIRLVKINMALAGIACLSACEGDTGDLGGNRLASGNSAEVSPEGKAEEGRISMKGPGFDFALNIPGGIADRAGVDGGSKIVYPGATISGIHIAAGEGAGNGGVELRFASRDPIDKVLAWYQDPARRDVFNVGKVSRDGQATVVTGTTTSDRNDFKLRLEPRADGARGRLTISDRD